MKQVNGKPIRTGRGKNTNRPSRMLPIGQDDRPSALRKGSPLRPSKGTDSIIAAENQAKFWDCAQISESKEDHIIPRRSLTVKQHLGLFPQQFETEGRTTRQLDQSDLSKTAMIETTDQKVTWKSDRTLLRQGKPENWNERRIGPHFKRITAHTKVRKTEREALAPLEVKHVDPYDPQ